MFTDTREYVTLISRIEEEAKRHTEARQRRFNEEILRLLEPVRNHIQFNLQESKIKERAIERVEDVAMISKYAVEKTGLK